MQISFLCDLFFSSGVSSHYFQAQSYSFTCIQISDCTHLRIKKYKCLLQALSVEKGLVGGRPQFSMSIWGCLTILYIDGMLQIQNKTGFDPVYQTESWDNDCSSCRLQSLFSTSTVSPLEFRVSLRFCQADQLLFSQHTPECILGCGFLGDVLSVSTLQFIFHFKNCI